jgi:hypothetical protein
MLTYRFVLRNDGGHRVEGLGSMGLTGDDEALAFGKQVIRDLMLGDQRFTGLDDGHHRWRASRGQHSLETIQTTSRK